MCFMVWQAVIKITGHHFVVLRESFVKSHVHCILYRNSILLLNTEKHRIIMELVKKIILYSKLLHVKNVKLDFQNKMDSVIFMRRILIYGT